MAKRADSRPWWLEDGTEICSVCHHLYLYETEYRCSDCDGGVCAECIELTFMTCVPCAGTYEHRMGVE
jgi:hypothetical protein